MSGTPNTQQVNELRTALGEMHKAQVRVREIQRELARLNTEMLQKENLITARRDTITNLMMQMDVHSSSNIGWEGRIILLLDEVELQAREEGRKEVVEDRRPGPMKG
jgi:hypothetical protein